MAHGRPVVATRVGGLVDAVEDGVTGLLVEPGDVAGLREAVSSLLADPHRRVQLGRAARERAAERFSDEIATRALLSVYDDALARPRST